MNRIATYYRHTGSADTTADGAVRRLSNPNPNPSTSTNTRERYVFIWIDATKTAAADAPHRRSLGE